MDDTMGTGKRIVMVVGLFHPVVGGAEKVCQQLAKSLIAKGTSVTVLTQYCDGLPEYEVVDTIPVYRKMKGWHPLGFTYMFSVFSFLMKHRRRFDTIFCFGLFLFIPPAVVMKYLYRKKVVVRLMCSGNFGDFAGIRPLKVKHLITAAAKRCDRIIYLSNDMKRELLENNFRSEKLVCIPNGVNIKRFSPPPRSGDGPKNICFVGRIEAQKGLDTLLKAMAIIASRDKAVTLTIVGEGQQRAALEGLASSLSLRHRVVFTGLVEDVLTYYHGAHIFVLPSYAEGMSSALLEAMACGLPVVTTMVGGNREIVDVPGEAGQTTPAPYHVGERGIVICPGDVDGMAAALLKLLHDDTLSQQLAEKAQQYVRSRFSQEYVVGEYIKLCHRLN